MTPIKEARIRCCLACPHRRTAHADYWHWPRCVAGGRDASGEATLELEDMFMEGPDANCPDGRWAGLEPVDFEAEAEIKRARTREDWRAQPSARPLIMHLVRALTQAVPITTLRARIKEAVGSGGLPLWLAVDVARELGSGGLIPAEAYKIIAADGAGALLVGQGNDAAYVALRDCVEAAVLTRAEAEAIATDLGITD